MDQQSQDIREVIIQRREAVAAVDQLDRKVPTEVVTLVNLATLVVQALQKADRLVAEANPAILVQTLIKFAINF